MTIKITRPSATEQRRRAESETTGKNSRTLVAAALEGRLSLAQFKLRDILGPVHGDFQQSGMTDDELTALLKSSLEALSRDRKTVPCSPA